MFSIRLELGLPVEAKLDTEELAEGFDVLWTVEQWNQFCNAVV